MYICVYSIIKTVLQAFSILHVKRDQKYLSGNL
jgi:hypothetical protein